MAEEKQQSQKPSISDSFKTAYDGTDPAMKKIKSRIRKVVEYLGISNEELVSKTGLHRSTIPRLINAESDKEARDYFLKLMEYVTGVSSESFKDDSKIPTKTDPVDFIPPFEKVTSDHCSFKIEVLGGDVHPDTNKIVAFSEFFCHMFFKTDPKDVKIYRCTEKLHNYLSEDDIMVFDASVRRVVDNGIYIIEKNGVSRVVAVFFDLDGVVEIFYGVDQKEKKSVEEISKMGEIKGKLRWCGRSAQLSQTSLL